MTEQHQGEEGKELACQVSKPRHEIEENGEYQRDWDVVDQ
jgi:hypothetical protein